VKAHERTLRDGPGEARVAGDERVEDLAVVGLRMLDVERCVQREVAPRLAADTQPL
jgi:hypothetical protein